MYHTYFHLFQLPAIVDMELGVLSVMVNDICELSIFSALFSLKLRILFEKGILVIPVQNVLYHPWSYRITKGAASRIKGP